METKKRLTRDQKPETVWFDLETGEINNEKNED